MEIRVKPGDKVRVVAPAGKGAVASLPLIKTYVESLELVAEISDNIYDQSEPFYSNTDEFRATDLISAITDPDCKVIWCIRGGSGSMRLIPFLEERLPDPGTLSPKLLIGFSDITVLLSYFQKKFNWACIHGGMLEGIVTGTYDPESPTVQSLIQLMFNMLPSINLPLLTRLDQNPPLVTPIVTKVVGGNVTLVEASIGTLWQVDTANNIIFLEDTGEAPYRLERSLDHMKQAGMFNSVRAAIFGDFTAVSDQELLRTAIQRFANSVTFPVFRVAGMGHGSTNLPLPMWTPAVIRLDGANYSWLVSNVPVASLLDQ